MNWIILIFSLFIGIFGSSQQLPNNLSSTERQFVRNVINIEGSKPVEITKREDNHIVIEFEYTMVVLKPDGFIGDVWILDDGDWINLGKEEDAY